METKVPRCDPCKMGWGDSAAGGPGGEAVGPVPHSQLSSQVVGIWGKLYNHKHAQDIDAV